MNTTADYGSVFLPTMGRPKNIQRIVPRWRDLGMKVYLVVNEDEADLYFRMRETMGWPSVSIWAPRVYGIGAIRRAIVQKASRKGLQSIILAEDDASPNAYDSWGDLLRIARRPDVLGIGATRPIHDRFTGGAVSANHGPIICPGGWGFVLFALNVQNAIAAGNYDAKLHTIGDDAELARNGIAKLQIPWLAHCDVRWTSIGTRYSAGGIEARFDDDREARAEAERECLALIHERWPAYTNPPGKRLRVAWQKMLSDYIPNWKEMSAIHGGKLPWV